MSFPSATARPTAVEVKLLLSENSMCGSLGGVGRPPAFGDDRAMTHQHEAVEGIELLLGRVDEAQEGGR